MREESPSVAARAQASSPVSVPAAVHSPTRRPPRSEVAHDEHGVGSGRQDQQRRRQGEAEQGTGHRMTLAAEPPLRSGDDPPGQAI
jgi:hypothetical protein